MRSVAGAVVIAVIAMVLGGCCASASADEFRMTNDEPFEKMLDAYWQMQPRVPVPDDTMQWWFREAMGAADHRRWYRLAEALAREDVSRWPYDAPAWVGLSCYVGKQGRYQEALDLSDEAAALDGISRDWPRAVGATWLWMLGRHDEADLRMSGIRRPPGAAQAQRLWIACRIFYLSVRDPGAHELRTLIGELVTRPRDHQWVQFLERDVAFDALRELLWFGSLVGATASGPPPSIGIRPLAPDQAEARLIQAIPHQPIDPAYAVHLGQATTLLYAGEWQAALDIVRRLPHQTPDARILEALSRAALDDATGAMDGLRALNHGRISLDTWTIDLYGLTATSVRVANHLSQLARSDPAMRRPLALALIIRSAFRLDGHDDNGVITNMDAAGMWCGTLAEIPNLRGIALYDLHEEDKADAEFRKAIAIRPSFTDPLFNLAVLQARLRHYHEALDLMTQIAAIHPLEPMEVLHYDECLTGCGRAGEAMASLDALLAGTPPLHPGLPESIRTCAAMCVEQRHFTAAEHELRQLLAHFPWDTISWIRLAQVLMREGDYQAGIDAARNALDIGPTTALFAAIAIDLGGIGLGRTDAAVADLCRLPVPETAGGMAEAAREYACCAALLHDESALKWFLEAVLSLDVHRSTSDRERWSRWLATDIYLDPYRDHPWFQELVQQHPSSQPQRMPPVPVVH